MKALPHRGLLVAALVLLLGGCNDDKPTKPLENTGGVVPDFKILDVNPNSSAYGDSVSPREYLGQISCWYFGHAT